MVSLRAYQSLVMIVMPMMCHSLGSLGSIGGVIYRPKTKHIPEPAATPKSENSLDQKLIAMEGKFETWFLELERNFNSIAFNLLPIISNVLNLEAKLETKSNSNQLHLESKLEAKLESILETKLETMLKSNQLKLESILESIQLKLEPISMEIKTQTSKIDSAIISNQAENVKIKNTTNGNIREIKQSLFNYTDSSNKNFELMSSNIDLLLTDSDDCKQSFKIIEDINKNNSLYCTNAENISNESLNQISLLKNTTNELEMKINEIDKVGNILLRRFQKNCYELLKMGDIESGVRHIYPFMGSSMEVVEAYCDQKDSDGGWTVIQRRDDLDVREDFFRAWSDYEVGFGNRTGEYWLGLEAIHALTTSRPMELMVRLETFDGKKGYAKYKAFSVGNAGQEYKLTVGGYVGDAGDALKFDNGMRFSTNDNDNDNSVNSCATNWKGAWWYNTCSYSNLNGLAGSWQSNESIHWLYFKSKEDLRRVMLMIRPLDRAN